MAVKTIIYSQVDQEPQSFCQDDIDGKTISFAVNLSIDCRATPDGEALIKSDEDYAQGEIEGFLKTAHLMRIAIYRVADKIGDGISKLTLWDAGCEEVRAPHSPAMVAELMAWLAAQKSAIPQDKRRFWAPLEVRQVGFSEDETDAKAAGAGDRLRAIQSWNAPVGHLLGLTRIVRADPEIFVETGLVALPFLEGVNPPNPIYLQIDLDPASSDPIEVNYKPGGPTTDDVVCRATPVPIGTPPMDLSNLKEDIGNFTSEGFLVTNPHATEVHRVTRWFEQRAASMMMTAAALGPRDGSKEELERVEKLCTKPGADPNGFPDFQWPNAIWYGVSRLVASLDNLVISVMQPGEPGSYAEPDEPIREGEVLAPLVSSILYHLSDIKPPLEDKWLDPVKIVGAIRKVLRAKSPLIVRAPVAPPDPSDADEALAWALKLIHAIPARGSSPIVDDTDLVAELVSHFEAGDLNAVSDRLKKYRDTAAESKLKFGETITRAFSEFEQRLNDETSAEAAIVRFLETVSYADPKKVDPPKANYVQFAEQFLGLAAGLDDTTTAAIRLAFERAWIEYRGLLDGPFNGAEAIRQTAGGCFTRRLLTVVEAKFDSTADEIASKLKTSEYFWRRFLGVPVIYDPKDPKEVEEKSRCFDAIANALLRVNAAWQPNAALLDDAHLKSSFADAVEPIDELTKPQRFVPDQFPRPLPVQIAANIDGSKVDEFAKVLNGIALAIRRLDGNADKFAYANLADLYWTRTQPVEKVEPAPQVSAVIHPMLPAVSDGRAPMFIEYHGYPFAADMPGGVPVNNGNAEVDKTEPFYRYAPHREPPPPTFALLPRLAYGRAYQTFAFVTSNAGTLPLELQIDPSKSPWMPAPLGDQPPKGADPVPVDYQRTTAISEMTIAEPKNEPTLIGKAIEKVHPLAHDYPRAIVFATKGNTAHCDLFRSQGGFGEIAIPSEKSTTRNITLSEMRWGGKPKAIRIEIMDRLSGQPHVIKRMTKAEIDRDGLDGERAALAIEIPVDDRTKLTVTFRTIVTPAAAGLPKGRYAVVDGADYPIPQSFSESCWLRLVIEAGDTDASISFAEVEGAATAAAGGPLLLLRPHVDKEAWITGIAQDRTVEISTPRVTYCDFERWYANPDKRPSLDASLAYALLMANLLRHSSEKLVNLIDRLPDPAVTSVRIDFAEIDSLSASVRTPRSAMVDISGLLGKFVMNKLPGIVKTLTHRENDKTLHNWTVEALEALLAAIDQQFQFSVKFAADNQFGLDAGKLEVASKEPYVARAPAGSVTRLTLHAHVPIDHFTRRNHPSMFDARLLQYATVVDADGHSFAAFQGASVRMEVMADALGDVSNNAIDLADAMIAIEPVERVRRYDLKTLAGVPQGFHAAHWRLLSEVDVTTQRWRPSGRPIYSYVRPHDHVDDDWVGKPANAVAWPLSIEKKKPAPAEATTLNEKLARFEHEAFFDRQDFDAHTVTQRLLPLPSRTVLQEFPWEAPSATYFRHRFTLRSRYAGALRTRKKRECDAWPVDRVDHEWSLEWARPWTKRAVMLADASRILLTRPQLRALIPLTTAPDTDGRAQPAPPVAAILQEPPHAFGLADRIATEVKTGFGYGFNKNQPKDDDLNDIRQVEIPPVEILDSRKEAGPVPYLTYRPFRRDSALGLTLMAEGPMGLTFDQIDASAPAFPNSMLTLRPTTWLGKEPPLEELMMGVAMRRYIDPHWTTAKETLPKVAKSLRLGLDQSWLIEVTPSNSSPDQLVCITEVSVDPSKDHLELFTLTLENGIVSGKVFKTPIDGVDKTGMPIEIARFENDRCSDILILHQPVAPGRYCTAILATPKTPIVGDGGSNVPVVMASFEWSLPQEKKIPSAEAPKPTTPLLSVAGKLDPRAMPTIASAQTFIRWTKTSRDFDFVHVAEKDASGWKPSSEPVRGLTASVGQDGRLKIGRGRPDNDVWLCSSTFTSPYPLHVHRHIGVISSRLLNELGRPVERPQRSAASGVRQPKLVSMAGQQVGGENACRIVEYETPAAILCNHKLLFVPETYKTAYFDLFSTGFKSSVDATLRLFFRFVAPFVHIVSLKKIELKLWTSYQQGRDRPTFKLELPAGEIMVGLYVTIAKSSASKPTFEFLTQDGRRVGGGYTSEDTIHVGAATQEYPGLYAQISGDSISELWTDVSLLHSAGNTTDEPFDFDWLFSAAGSSNPVEDVSPARLNDMSEAQARIISISPPIPMF